MTPPATRRAFLALVPLAQLPAWAAQATGRVVGVIDGDTLDILTAGFETLRVRLSGIDAPELGQAFGRNAKAALSSFVFARSVAIEWRKRDRYDRVVAKVTLEGRDIALEMLALGMAGITRASRRSKSELTELYMRKPSGKRGRSEEGSGPIRCRSRRGTFGKPPHPGKTESVSMALADLAGGNPIT